MNKLSLSPRFVPACFAAALAGAVLIAQPACAQHVVLTVNGDPITAFDIEQRSKLITLTSRKQPPRQEVLDDLINDKVKVHIGRRYRLEIDDNDVNKSFNDMARRMRLDGDGLVKVLQQQGVQPYTLRDRIRAEIVWQQIIRAKFSSSLQQSEKEVAQALETRKKDDKDAATFEYVLRPILFVIPRNSADGAVEARRRDAEALRTRFTDCDSGIPLARGLRDVAVRESIRKTSADLAPALRELLDNTPVGRLTAPEVTPQGVEVFALCVKRETKADSAAKREVQNEIFSEKYQMLARKFLKELRTQAMIEFKDGSDAKPSGGNTR
jgi:peptidyl-prolyl cis-trans isomerase SurA